MYFISLFCLIFCLALLLFCFLEVYFNSNKYLTFSALLLPILCKQFVVIIRIMYFKKYCPNLCPNLIKIVPLQIYISSPSFLRTRTCRFLKKWNYFWFYFNSNHNCSISQQIPGKYLWSFMDWKFSLNTSNYDICEHWNTS